MSNANKSGIEMTDVEMLKLAAKAAGLQWLAAKADEGLLVGTTCDDSRIWNPLTDDSDAFRLAVKLQMSTDIGATEISVCWWFYDEQGRGLAAVYEPVSDDLAAATRRAIVRAAAEEGEALQ